MAAKHHYEVVVGDESVYRSTYHETSVGKREAVHTYNDFVKKSKQGIGWAAGLDVILLQDEKAVRKFVGWHSMNPRRKRNPKVGGVKFVLKRVRLTRDGYEPGTYGQYWGVGAPLYTYSDYETGDISGHFRASSKAEAMEKLAQAVKYKI